MSLKSKATVAVLILICTIGTRGLHANTEPSPTTLRITKAPPETISAIRGDVLQLNVEFQGDPTLYQKVKWTVKSVSMVCREKNCKFKTSSLKPGKYAVYIVVFDKNSSDSMRFDLRVREPNRGEKPAIKTIKAEPVDPARSDVNFSESKKRIFSGYYATTVAGKTFANSNRRIDVIGTQRRQINQFSTLRTASDGLMRIYRTGENETWLSNRTFVNLDVTKSGRGLIRLVRGAVRSRSLGNLSRSAQWDVAAGGYMFKGDQNQDFIVKTIPGDELLVASLRSSLNIHAFDRKSGNADKESFFRLPAGSIIRLKTIFGDTNGSMGKSEPGDSLPERTAIASILRETSPQYLDKRTATDTRVFLNPLPPVNFKSALRKATDAINRNDALLAAEQLLFDLDTAGKSPEAAYVLGRAYLFLHLDDEGENWMKKGIEIMRAKKSSKLDSNLLDDLHGALGRLYFRNKMWPEAAVQFTEINLTSWLERNKLNANLAFEVGKSFALGGMAHEAKHLLIWSTEHSPVKESREESRILLKDLEIYPGSTARISAGIIYNSNVLGLQKPGDQKSLPEGIDKNQTGMWVADLSWKVRSSAADDHQTDSQTRYGLSASVNLLRESFFEKSLLPYTFSKYSGKFGFFFTPAAENSRHAESTQLFSRPALFDLDVHSYFEVGGIGDQRVHDEAGAGTALTIPRLLDASVSIRYGRVIDPQKDLQHAIDYLSREPALGTDDSGTITGIGLKLVPIGPNNLDGEPPGTTRLQMQTDFLRANHQSYPNGSGQRQQTNVKIEYTKKFLMSTCISIHAGATLEKHDLTAEQSSYMAAPSIRQRINFGLQYAQDINEYLSLGISTSQFMVTQTPSESFTKFNRSVTGLFVSWNI